MGYDTGLLPYSEWLEAQREASQRDDVVGSVLGGATSGEHEIRDDNTYDDRNTRRALEGSGLERPAVDAGLLEGYAHYFAERGWIRTPPALSGGRQAST